MSNRYVDEEEEMKGEKISSGPATRFREFDCPSCNANNPSDEFGNGEEVLCNYCGSSYEAKVTEEGRLKLKEL